MTVAELRKKLEMWDQNAPVVIGNLVSVHEKKGLKYKTFKLSGIGSDGRTIILCFDTKKGTRGKDRIPTLQVPIN